MNNIDYLMLEKWKVHLSILSTFIEAIGKTFISNHIKEINSNVPLVCLFIWHLNGKLVQIFPSYSFIFGFKIPISFFIFGSKMAKSIEIWYLIGKCHSFLTPLLSFNQANALVLPLKILQQHFGIKFCSYTYLKAVMGPTKEIKCPTLGPSSHKKSMRWDFSANLVPAPCPSLEEEAVRYMPSLWV